MAPENAASPSTIAVALSSRPAVVERKKRCGDWEADTIIGRSQQGGARLCSRALDQSFYV
jgi:IS30 family transposase